MYARSFELVSDRTLRCWRNLFACTVLSFLMLAHLPAQATASRVALVIGNAEYTDRPLRNPENDAEAVATALRALGFDVTEKTNLTIEETDSELAAFRSKLATADEVGLFYYSGHGAQKDGDSYLIPVGEPITDALQIERKTLATSRVLEAMSEGTRKLNIVILDACRDWPFPSGAKSLRKGLGRIDAVPSFVIAYATGKDQTAADGDGSLSTYTQSLLKFIQSDISVNDLFQAVSMDVAASTQNVQVPAVYASAVPPINLTKAFDASASRQFLEAARISSGSGAQKSSSIWVIVGVGMLLGAGAFFVFRIRSHAPVKVAVARSTTPSNLDLRSRTDTKASQGLVLRDSESGQLLQRIPHGQSIIVGNCADAWNLRIQRDELSKRHAEFGVDDAGAWVMDLNSANGTWLGPKQQVLPGRKQRLSPGTIVYLADRRTSIKVELS